MKRILFVMGFLGLAALVVWLSFPAILRWQVTKRHPEVTFGEGEATLHKVILHQVSINKGWVKVTGATATIDLRTGTTHLSDGTAEIDLDQRSAHKGGDTREQARITVARFTFHVTSLTREVTADLQGVTVTDQVVMADEADVRYKGYHVKFGPLDVTKAPAVEMTHDLKRVKITNAYFPEGVNLREMHLTTIGGNDIDVDIENRTATVSVFSLGVGGQAVTIQLLDSRFSLDGDSLTANVATLVLYHPRLNGTQLLLHRVSGTVGRDWMAPTDIKIGEATFHVDPTTKSVSADESCSTWVKALPEELARPPISGLTQWGLQPQLSRLKFSFGLLPKPHFSLQGGCSATCTDPEVVKLKHRFKYTTYDEHGALSDALRETGPETPEWVHISAISDNMFDAVVNMEDPGFPTHRGYSNLALANSFIEDVKSDKFIRGGSTITMQTAKNIFLARDKTIGRKVSELFLSQVLESCFQKREIMELYLNVVEFGPNLYGLRQGAIHYFKTEPSQLDPQEAFYLAWILPRPRNVPPPDAATMTRIASLMRTLGQQQGRISEAQMLGVQPADTAGWETP
jgi:hypothetical protein